MNNQRPEMFVPALIGGVVAGILSCVWFIAGLMMVANLLAKSSTAGLLIGAPIFNCLCCLWIIGGAMLASYLLAKNSPVALSAGDGAIVGVFSGIIAAVANTFVSIPFERITVDLIYKIIEYLPQSTEEMPFEMERLMEGGAEGTTISGFFFSLVIKAIIFSILGALGGIIGISLFGKKFLPDKPEGGGDVPKDTSYR